MVAALIAFAVGSLLAQAPGDGTSTQTPGSVLLLTGRTEPDPSSELKNALLSPNADTRAAAARVIGLAPAPALANDVLGALARERDADVGAEMVRALLYLRGAAALPPVDVQAARLGGPALVVVAEWLARTDPHMFAERLPALASIGPGARADALVRLATMRDAATRDTVVRAWMAVAPAGGWRPLLDRLFGPPATPSAGTDLLIAALSSDRPSIREETAWFLVQLVASRYPLDDTIAKASAAERDDQTPWERVGREWLRRTRGNVEPVDCSTLLQEHGRGHITDLFHLGVSPRLTDGERRILKDLVPSDLTGFRWAPLDPSASLIAPFRPGLLRSLIDGAGCEVRGDSIAFATVTYGPVGTPRKVLLSPMGVSNACQSALAVLARLNVADPDLATHDTAEQILMVPFTPSFVLCVSQEAGEASRLGTASGDGKLQLEAPRKVHDLRPVYPIAALQDRVQGVVIIDARISRDGCVSRAAVIRSIPALDLAALRAVSEWRYTPARLDGVPVPVIMTVTVNFALQ